MADSRRSKAIAQIIELCGITPVARLVVNVEEFASHKYEPKLDDFVAGLNLQRAAARPAAGPDVA